MDTWTTTEQDIPEIAPGWYPADFNGVSPFDKGNFGPGRSWDFTIYLDGDPQRVSRVTSLSTSSQSEGYAMLCGILGRQPEVGEEVQMGPLTGKRVEVLIGPNKKDWPTVQKVRVPKKATAAE